MSCLQAQTLAEARLPLKFEERRVVVDILPLVLGDMSEHKVAAHRILHSFRHILATMKQSSLLENQNPSLLRFNVYESFFVSIPRKNPCSTTFHVFVTQIDLKSNSGFPSVWEFELTIAMASEVIPLCIAQEAKAFIETAEVFTLVLI